MTRAGPPSFVGAAFDRMAHLRGDAEAMARVIEAPETRALPFWRGKPLVFGPADDDLSLGWTACDHPVLSGPLSEACFLGAGPDGAHRFAVDLRDWTPNEGQPQTLGAFLDPSEQVHPGFPTGHRFAELRRIMTRLPAGEAALAATGRALVSWHARHRFCANCGAASHSAQAGWQRDCPACGTSHYPRTDPVVIMLVLRGNAVLVGRSPGWPEGMYSLLAGFVEPGETIEAAVRRETLEETGIRIGRVGYMSSQPWPFPASLMIGCWAHAESAAITVDPAELEDAQWLSRETAMDVMAGLHPAIHAPRRGAIAHHLIGQWLRDQLPPGAS